MKGVSGSVWLMRKDKEGTCVSASGSFSRLGETCDHLSMTYMTPFVGTVTLEND